MRYKASGGSLYNQAAKLVARGNKGPEKTGKKKFMKSGSEGPKLNDICNYFKELGHWKNRIRRRRRSEKQKSKAGTAAITEGDDTNSKEDITLIGDGKYITLMCGSSILGHLTKYVRGESYLQLTSKCMEKIFLWLTFLCARRLE